MIEGDLKSQVWNQLIECTDSLKMKCGPAASKWSRMKFGQLNDNVTKARSSLVMTVTGSISTRAQSANKGGSKQTPWVFYPPLWLTYWELSLMERREYKYQASVPSLLQKEEESVVAESKTTSRTARGQGGGINEWERKKREPIDTQVIRETWFGRSRSLLKCACALLQ